MPMRWSGRATALAMAIWPKMGSEIGRSMQVTFYRFPLAAAPDLALLVGLPSTPPIYRKLNVTLQLFEKKRRTAESPNEPGLVILAGNSLKTQKRLISLTIPCLQKIRTAMLDRRLKPSGKPTHAELDAAIMDAKTWRELTVPFELPGKGKTFFGDLLVIAPAHMRSEQIKSFKTVARLIVNLEESELA